VPVGIDRGEVCLVEHPGRARATQVRNTIPPMVVNLYLIISPCPEGRLVSALI
jgi:hypothetical protein